MKPSVAFLEITSHCNFKCEFCPSELLKREKGNLNLADGEKFIKQVAKLYPRTPIQFNVLGEPFINKDIFSYFDLCKKYNVAIILITNYSLLSDEIAERLFSSYKNFSLVLSLQTPTEKSFQMRNCKSYNFQEYFQRIEKLIELKFKHKCICSIEIHIASNSYMLKNDSTIQSDIDFEPFQVFESAQEREQWHLQYLEYLSQLQKRIARDFKIEYNYLEDYALTKYEHEINTGMIINEKQKVPVNMFEMTENQLWGYMCMPSVFLRYKTFGPWTKDPSFLKTLCDRENTFVYVAKRFGFKTCELAQNIGVLSNGEIVSCCLDYEGEMKYGNIRDLDLHDKGLIKKLEADQQNVLTHDICRRCKGDVIIANTEPIVGNKQEVVFFASDWFPYEKEMHHGLGGRWSKCVSSAYIYARLDAEYLDMQVIASTPGECTFVKIYSYHPDKDKFSEEFKYAFKGCGSKEMVRIPFSFHLGTFYKIEVNSPTFRPSERFRNSDDTRDLGICLINMKIVKSK